MSKGKPKRLSLERQESIVRKYVVGVPLKDIARIHNVAPHRVIRCAKAFGVSLRSQIAPEPVYTAWRPWDGRSKSKRLLRIRRQLAVLDRAERRK